MNDAVTRWARRGLYALIIVVAGLAVGYGQYLLAVFVALVFAIIASAQRGTRLAYRAGWFKGQAETIASLDEAQDRGMSFEQWLTSQAERSAAMFKDPRWPR